MLPRTQTSTRIGEKVKRFEYIKDLYLYLSNNSQILVRLVKAMVFPVVMYGCESWTVKKAER